MTNTDTKESLVLPFVISFCAKFQPPNVPETICSTPGDSKAHRAVANSAPELFSANLDINRQHTEPYA